MTPTEKQPSDLLIAELAAQYGVSERTVGRWKRDGVDVHDSEAVEAYRATLQDRKSPGGNDAKELKEKKLLAETRLKEAQAERAELQLAEARGEVVRVADVAETVFAIASQVAAQLARLEGELPGLLEGLNAASMQPILRERTDAVRAALAENLCAVAVEVPAALHEQENS